MLLALSDSISISSEDEKSIRERLEVDENKLRKV